MSSKEDLKELLASERLESLNLLSEAEEVVTKLKRKITLLGETDELLDNLQDYSGCKK